MRAGVLFMVVMCLGDGEVTGCSEKKNVTASELSKVSISCPSAMTNSSEIKYLLLFNNSTISEIYLSKQPDSAGILFSGQFEVTARQGQFICKRELIIPPPHSQDCHTTEVKVEENLMNDTVSIVDQSCPVRTPLIPEQTLWAGCGVLLVYSLSLTCVAVIKWRKLKRDLEDTPEYINARPVKTNNNNH